MQKVSASRLDWVWLAPAFVGLGHKFGRSPIFVALRASLALSLSRAFALLLYVSLFTSCGHELLSFVPRSRLILFAPTQIQPTQPTPATHSMYAMSLLIYQPFALPAFAALANVADFVYWCMLDKKTPGTYRVRSHHGSVSNAR